MTQTVPDFRLSDRGGQVLITSEVDGLTRDCFGRVVTTHRCPECGASFLSKAMCRGVGDGPGKRAHDHEVETLPIVGCTLPPNQRYVVGFGAVSIMAPTPSMAEAMAERMVAETLPKRVVERYGYMFRAEPIETQGQANLRCRMDAMRDERLRQERAHG